MIGDGWQQLSCNVMCDRVGGGGGGQIDHSGFVQVVDFLEAFKMQTNRIYYHHHDD